MLGVVLFAASRVRSREDGSRAPTAQARRLQLSPEDASHEHAIAVEHRRLEAMFAEVLGALRDGEPTAAIRECFAALRDALEAHVDHEDRLYYPALGTLRPAHRPAIERLIEGHVALRTQLRELESTLDGGDTTRFEAALQAFVLGFAAHEVAEEALLRALDAELRAASRSG